MPHFKVSDDSHAHPKAIMAGDAAWGMWNRAGCWSMAYGTDGFVPDWWVKQQPQGAAKAKALINAQLWQRGEYPGDRPEYKGQRGYVFHEWRQDSYAKVEADREKARKRMNAARSSANVRPEHPPNNGRTSPEHPGIPITPKKNSSAYVQAATHDSTEPRSAPVGEGWPLVREIVSDEHPQAVRTELAIQASALLKAGSAPDDVADALRLWPTKNLGPKALPSLVSEVINTRNRPTTDPSQPRQPPSKRKVNQALDLAAQFAQTPPNTHALEPR